MTLPGCQGKPSQSTNTTTSSLDVRSRSPNISPQSSPRLSSKGQHKRDSSVGSKETSSSNQDKLDANDISLTAELSGNELSRSNSQEPLRDRRSQERTKKKTPWYSALYPTYKTKNEDFKRIFKDLPPDERLVVDYSCAIQRDILAHGRLYISQNYLCFYANIFRWETNVVIKWKEVTALTKEKTALVIPNAILVHTDTEKHFLTSFGSRDKAYLMLFRVWQNALLDQHFTPQELWQLVRLCYGEELGLTSDDDEYIPLPNEDEKSVSSGKGDRQSVDSLSEESVGAENQNISTNILNLEPEENEEQNLIINTSSGAGDINNSLLTVNGDLATDSFPQFEDNKTIDKDNFDSSGPATTVQAMPPNNSVNNQQNIRRSNSDMLPSDLSDSSASESESEKQNKTIITCPVNHEGRLMLHMQVSIHVDQLFTHLFTNSKFFSDLHETRKTTDVKQSAWIFNPSTNQKGRTVSLTVPLGQSIGPKHCHVTESQKMLPCSKPGEMYAIEIEISNSGIPYAESFYICSHYCLTRSVDPNTSTIAVYCQIKYRKSCWGFVKSIIEKNCWSGLEEYYTQLVEALTVECERTHRAMASGLVSSGGKRKTRMRRRSKQPVLPMLPCGSVVLEEQPPLIQPLTIPPPYSPRQRSPKWMSYLIFLAFVCLLIANAALYHKLWELEKNTKHVQQTIQFNVEQELFKQNPQSEEDWRNLLQRQEQLHSAEIQRWLKILEASIHLLRQVEHSLNALKISISTIINDSLVINEKIHSNTKENSRIEL